MTVSEDDDVSRRTFIKASATTAARGVLGIAWQTADAGKVERSDTSRVGR